MKEMGLDIQEKPFSACENLDKTLKQVLSNAVNIMEACMRVSKNDAELIIKEANIKAQTSVKNAQDELTKIQEDVNKLKDIKKHFEDEMGKIIARNMAKLD